jgi:hypothetical protein
MFLTAETEKRVSINQVRHQFPPTAAYRGEVYAWNQRLEENEKLDAGELG